MLKFSLKNLSLQKYKWHARVIVTVLIVKFLILAFGVQAFQIVGDQALKESYMYHGIWRRWDAESYLSIAQYGYTAEGERRFLLAFFPLYPALVALFNLVFADYVLSGILVSALATIALGLVFRELVRLDYNEKTAQLAVLFLFIFPTGYFLHIPYTESLFLALTVGSFLAARKRSWLAAGVLGGLASLTRINGLFLFFALLFELRREYRETKKVNYRWLGLLLIPAGFGLYLALNYYVTGNPLMFLKYQREHWQKYLAFPWAGLWQKIDTAINLNPNSAQMAGFQELFFVGIGSFALLAGWRYLRGSYRAWMAMNWLLFISTSFILSVPRYTLILFPIFILMALAARRNWTLNVLFTVWSILYLAAFTSLFVRGWWAF